MLLWAADGALSLRFQGVSAQPPTPDAGQPEGLLSAVAEMWLRSHGLVWEGPRVMVDELEPPPAQLASSTSTSVLLTTAGVRPSERDLRAANRGLSLARFAFKNDGWPMPETTPFELYIVDVGHATGPQAHVRALYSEGGHDRAAVFATMGEGLFAFDPEACSIDAFARSMLRALDPSESAAWREASARALTRDLLGRSCTDPFSTSEQDALEDPAAFEVVRSLVGLRELWALGQQWTWEGMGLRASPNLWEVLAYVVQGKALKRSPDDVWEQFAERVVLSRGLAGELAEHPPFNGKTRRIWGDLTGLEPLGVEGVRFEVEAGPPLQIWLHGEPGTKWLLNAQALDAAGRTLTAVGATSKNRLDRSAEVLVYHPLETPKGTEQVVIYAANLGAEVRALATPALQRRAFYLVVSRAK